MEEKRAIAELIRKCMPGVAALVQAKRRELGDAYVVECQKRGMRGEPGWFYAAEGPVAVGTPWPEALDLVCARITPTQALLLLRPLEAVNGTN